MAGVASIAYAFWRFPAVKIDLRFLLLMGITVLVSSRASVRIPRVNANVTVTDTFIFLMLLLHGAEAGMILAAAEGVFSALRISKRPLTIMFNSAMMVCSTFSTIIVVRLFVGSFSALRTQHWSHVVAGIGAMALTMYFANTGISAIGLGLKQHESVWRTWQNNYLWLSITYIGGAALAGGIAHTIDQAGVAVLIIVPLIVAFIYYSYQKYLDDVTATSAQAEQAERARAEAAERHVDELNLHIAEQERISLELAKSREHFRHAALHDALTGLPNRALFSELLASEFAAPESEDRCSFAVLFFDLDGFKNINDSLGHAYGDKLLVSLAKRLRVSLRPSDTLARFGGDEFAVLLKELNGAEQAAEIADRLQRDISVTFDLDGHTAFTSASIGIAMARSGETDAADLLRDADIAMYRAKENGKRCYAIFDETMHDRAVMRLRLESDLRDAIERKEFCLHYQPIVDLETTRLAGFEALVRWKHPTKGMVPPGDFIALAEETGLIVPIGSWVLEEACRQMKEWQNKLARAKELKLSVNLSSKQVAQSDIATHIIDIVGRTGLDPRRLNLEITESVVMANDESANELFNTLRAFGVQLSIDDFGTGYSSLSYLRKFPVNYLKIDRSFVSQMEEAEESVEIVKTIIELARVSKMKVVAEGIETREHLTRLQQLNCEYGQGYLFSPPVDKSRAEAFLMSGEPWLAVLNECSSLVVTNPNIESPSAYAM
jgi:diguanylate cyclase (GGDEF)-like protein